MPLEAASTSALRAFFFAWFLGVICITFWNSYEVETVRIVGSRRIITRILAPSKIFTSSNRTTDDPYDHDATTGSSSLRGESSSSPISLQSPSETGKMRSKLSFETVFEDAKAYMEAEYVEVGPPLKKSRYDGAWSQLQLHEDYFRMKPHRRHVPTLAVPLSPIEFVRLFMMTSTAVRIPSHLVQDMGWKVQTWTLRELEQRFPFDGDWEAARFHHNRANDEEASLGNMGAAVQVLKQLENVSRVQPHPTYAQAIAEHKVESGQTRYIHNMRVRLDHLDKVGIESPPPLLEPHRFQLPTLWMGSPNVDTALHHDSTDNFALQLMGTKRWSLFPPTDARFLYNSCSGGFCKGQKLEHPDKPKSQLTRLAKSTLQKVRPIVVDLNPGDVLYLPNGWFHHVENIGVTFMANFWIRGKSSLYRAIELNHTAEAIAQQNYKAAPLKALFPKVKGIDVEEVQR